MYIHNKFRIFVLVKEEKEVFQNFKCECIKKIISYQIYFSCQS